MHAKAFAKINLSLDVIRRREDGYHELSSIFLPLSFYDDLSLEKSDVMSYSSNDAKVPFNEKHTVLKAIRLMQERYGIRDEFHIELNKKIPSQAGLAGGSADGAAALRILERMYRLHFSDEEIKDLCLSIGSDVYYCYYHRPTLVSGTGDVLHFFDLKEKYYVLLIKPNRGVSTKDAYGNLDIGACGHPDIGRIYKDLISGNDFSDELGNSLEYSSFRILPSLGKLKQELLDSGAQNALMSGSGSTIFTISKDKELIMKLYKHWKNTRYFVYHTEIMTYPY